MKKINLFFINRFKLVMINFNILILIYFTVFQISIVAQTTDSLNSSELINNTVLVFEDEMNYGYEDSSYTATIQLLGLDEKAQALQFRILINKASDDSPILIFNDIQKGSDINDPSWLIDFNVIDKLSEENVASRDMVFVLLYSQNLDGGLLPGEYKNLFTVNYSIADLPNSAKDVKSSMKISQAEASTSDGNAIDIKSKSEELKIIIKGK